MLRWKLPKTVKAGKYKLLLIFQGATKARTKVLISR